MASLWTHVDVDRVVQTEKNHVPAWMRSRSRSRAWKSPLGRYYKFAWSDL